MFVKNNTAEQTCYTGVIQTMLELSTLNKDGPDNRQISQQKLHFCSPAAVRGLEPETSQEWCSFEFSLRSGSNLMEATRKF